MAETETEAALAQGFQPRTFSVKFWPPNLSTRAMLLAKMAKELSTDANFSQKYGQKTLDLHATLHAKEIENACFVTAGESFQREPYSDGTSALQLYGKEACRLMNELLKNFQEAPTADDVTPRPKDVVFDISRGKGVFIGQRGFIGAKEAKELLDALTHDGNLYNKIIFSNRSFGIEAAQVAQPILASLKDQLTQVDLSDFVGGRTKKEALEVMKIFSSALEGCALRYLNLSENDMGEEGLRAFESLLKSQTRLEELLLWHDEFLEEGAKALVELIPSTKMLKILHFHDNLIYDEGAVAIAQMLKRSPLLEDFRFTEAGLNSQGGIAIAKALESCRRLKKLALWFNNFGVEGGIALGSCLGKLNCITELNLSFMSLKDKGAIAICDALKSSSPDLELLNMAGNYITAEAAKSLAACVAVKRSLKQLILYGNALKDSGAVLIAKALGEMQGGLKVVDMSQNMITKDGAVHLARAVASNKPEFKMLYMNGNAISDEAMDEVKAIVKEGCVAMGP